MPKFYYSEARKALFDTDQTELKLRPQSLDVFRFLFLNAGQVISKEDIFKEIWGDINVTDDSITQCIHDIRRVLGKEHRALLKTIPKRGYTLSLGTDTSGNCVLQRLDSHNSNISINPSEYGSIENNESLKKSKDSSVLKDRSNMCDEMLGRSQELSVLTDYWNKARAGSGRLVLLIGKAGIGKSRVARALFERIPDDSCYRFTYQCSPHYKDTALHPAIQNLLLMAGFVAQDLPLTRLEKLETLMKESRVNLSESMSALGPLMGIEELTEAKYGGYNWSPEEQRNRTLLAMLLHIQSCSKLRPLLLVVEDAHWIDPTTLELLEQSLENLSTHRILVLVTARPNFKHDFFGHPAVSQLALNPLAREQIRTIVDRITGGAPLTNQKLGAIADITDGIPLFVEELAKTIVAFGDLPESGIIGSDVIDFERVTLPDSLHASLMTRLERRHTVKTVAQTAACIGREFTWSALERVSVIDRIELQQAIKYLIEAELIYQLSDRPCLIYTFKHALVRDAAYDSLPENERREIHRLLFHQLESEHDAKPEILAYHANLAGSLNEAKAYWELAGNRAAQRSALKEAVSHFERAVKLTLPASRVNPSDRNTLELLVKMAHAAMGGWGYAHPITKRTFNQARVVLDVIPGSRHKFPVMYGQYLTSNVSGDLDDALFHAGQILQEAEQTDDRPNKMFAHRCLGATEFLLGGFNKSDKHYLLAKHFQDPKHKLKLFQQYGKDTNLSSRVIWAHGLICQGKATQALELIRSVVQEAENGGHILAISFVLSRISIVHQTAKTPGSKTLAYQALEYARANRFTMLEGFASCAYGAMLVDEGSVSEGASNLEHGLSRLGESKTNIYIHYYKCYLTKCIASMGQLSQAKIESSQDIEKLNFGADSWAAADAYRLLGEIDYKYFSNVSAATKKLEHGRLLAKKQGAALWLLRISISQAEMSLVRGDVSGALNRLQTDIDNFPDSGVSLADFKIGIKLSKQLRNI